MSSLAKRSFEGAGLSLLIVVLASALGLGFANLAGTNSIDIVAYSAVLGCAVFAFAVNWLAFIPSALAQKDTYYDSAGALTYLSAIGLAASYVWLRCELCGRKAWRVGPGLGS